MGVIALGQKVRDKVTGFEGIATSRTEFLNGCVQYSVKAPIDADGKMRDTEWFDEEQIEVVDQGILARVHAKVTGGPQETPGRAREHVPTRRT